MGCGQISGRAMWDIAVTVPTYPSHRYRAVGNGIKLTVFLHLRNNFCVAGDAVGLYPLESIFTASQVIAVGTESHGDGMVVAVSRFGDHLVDEGISRQVTVDTACFLAVGTVLPGCVVCVHGVAIDADLRIAGKV